MQAFSRRGVIGGGAVAPFAVQARGGGGESLRRRVLGAFRGLPGTRALKLWAPATASEPEILITENADQQLFIGSAIKSFILCERLRQLDAPDVATKLTGNPLALDASVWSVDSTIFNPPNLTGTVSERTAMEAMILHSDNTATDMVMRAAGPAKVRDFLAAAGLAASAVPESTRSFFGYLLGAPDYLTFTWAELVASADKPIVNSPLNEVQTLASSADDLVSFYARSVQGEFFGQPETLTQYRNVLALGDVIRLAFPLGGSVFAKGGSIDVAGFHALCVPAAVFLNRRWFYFAAIINWYAKAETDPQTVARYLAALQAALGAIYEEIQ
ncbi:serine hydrolase [Dankookia sp. P2]|uniref:serine hydrolase n=1 Tax=Dankookia sp. P2 TaxID=3423955 RepID=UPI003D666963